MGYRLVRCQDLYSEDVSKVINPQIALRKVKNHILLPDSSITGLSSFVSSESSIFRQEKLFNDIRSGKIVLLTTSSIGSYGSDGANAVRVDEAFKSRMAWVQNKEKKKCYSEVKYSDLDLNIPKGESFEQCIEDIPQLGAVKIERAKTIIGGEGTASVKAIIIENSVSFHASFAILGAVHCEGNDKILVTASNRTAAKTMGTMSCFGDASLLGDGKVLIPPRQLVYNHHDLWDEDQYKKPVGSTEFVYSDWKKNVSYTIKITTGYTLELPEGVATPTPSRGTLLIPLTVYF